jgi:hypothetical protein
MTSYHQRRYRLYLPFRHAHERRMIPPRRAARRPTTQQRPATSRAFRFSVLHTAIRAVSISQRCRALIAISPEIRYQQYHCRPSAQELLEYSTSTHHLRHICLLHYRHDTVVDVSIRSYIMVLAFSTEKLGTLLFGYIDCCFFDYALDILSICSIIADSTLL